MAEQQSSGGGSKLILILLGGVLLLCVCCCVAVVGTTALGLGAASTAVNTALSSTVCDEQIITADLTDVYQRRTTADFKAETSQEEFEMMVQTLNTDVCADLTGQDFLSSLQSGTSFNYAITNGQVELDMEGTFNGYRVLIEMRGPEDDLKIDRMIVEQL